MRKLSTEEKASRGIEEVGFFWREDEGSSVVSSAQTWTFRHIHRSERKIEMIMVAGNSNDSFEITIQTRDPSLNKLLLTNPNRPDDVRELLSFIGAMREMEKGLDLSTFRRIVQILNGFSSREKPMIRLYDKNKVEITPNRLLVFRVKNGFSMGTLFLPQHTLDVQAVVHPVLNIRNMHLNQQREDQGRAIDQDDIKEAKKHRCE
jgi:hypothetical protein